MVTGFQPFSGPFGWSFDVAPAACADDDQRRGIVETAAR
jgi:hypothetical protein